MERPLGLLQRRRESPTVAVCCPSSDPGAHWRTGPCSHACAEDGLRGQYSFEAAEDHEWSSLHSPSQATEPQEVCGAATSGCTSAPKSRQDMRPTIDYAASLAGGKKAKTAPRGEFVS